MQILKNSIRDNGLRITPARVEVLKILSESIQPLDISTIRKNLSERKVTADQATVYRIIENFVIKGLVSKLQFNEKKFYYELKGVEHHHATCKNCGKMVDVSKCYVNRVIKDLDKSKGFTVTSHTLEFFGTCTDCV